MDTKALNSRVQYLLQDLDSDNLTKVQLALIAFQELLPHLDLEAARHDADLRRTLYVVPDRLLQSLSENMKSPRVAKEAAFTLAAARYPAHYSKPSATVEETALKDIESIFHENKINAFFTAEACDVAGSDSTALDLRIWNQPSFTLNGARPRMTPSFYFESENAVSITAKGAVIERFEPVEKSQLTEGEFARAKALLKPDAASAVYGKAVVYTLLGENVYNRSVYKFTELFPKASPIAPAP